MSSDLTSPAVDRALSDDEVLDGRFRIVRFIGRGGMGEVYEARDQTLKMAVALKTIRLDRATEDYRERFIKEVHLSRAISHPNICHVFDIGTHRRQSTTSAEELPFFTMELLDGETLRARLSRIGALGMGDALAIASQLADGVAAAHKRGVVHRDLKPENILLTADPDGRVVVMDFGLAKALPPHPKADELLSSAAPGNLIGTLHYLAPEQILLAAASPASDVHALGVILYEMVCGQRPFDDSDRSKILDLIRQSPPAPPRTHVPTLDVAFETVIMRCLAKRPEDRYQDAGDVAVMLRDIQPARSSSDSKASTLSLTRGATAGAASSPVDPALVYREALDLAKNGDTVGWRQLRKKIRPGVFDSIVAWRAIHEKAGIPEAKPDAQAMIGDALLRLAPLFAIALAGIESGRHPFNDQKETIDELLQIPRWPPNGLSRLVEIPETFGYFYQGLHGALCLSTRQLPLAMALADRKVLLGHREYRPVWKWHGLVGWPDGLGSNSIDAWNSLNGLATEWPWLKHVFEGEDDLHASLAAYYMALNIGEMIWTLTNNPDVLKQKDVRFEVPVTFAMIDDEIGRAALKLLLRDREGLVSSRRRISPLFASEIPPLSRHSSVVVGFGLEVRI